MYWAGFITGKIQRTFKLINIKQDVTSAVTGTGSTIPAASDHHREAKEARGGVQDVEVQHKNSMSGDNLPACIVSPCFSCPSRVQTGLSPLWSCCTQWAVTTVKWRRIFINALRAFCSPWYRFSRFLSPHGEWVLVVWTLKGFGWQTRASWGGLMWAILCLSYWNITMARLFHKLILNMVLYWTILNFRCYFPNSETLQNVLSLLLWGLSQEVNYVSGCVILLSFLFWMYG